MRIYDLCRAVSAAVLAAVVLAGCSAAAGNDPAAGNEPGAGERAAGELTAPAEEACGPAVDAQVLAGGALLDFEARSLAELVAAEPLVVTGTVQGFARGHDVLSWNSDAGYHDSRDRWAVVVVEVDTVYKGAEYVSDGHVYVRLFRGAEGITEDRKPDREPDAPSTITSIEQLAAAAPAGVRVAVLSGPAKLRPHHGEKGIGTHRGYPEGTTLIGAGPQGLILEDGASCGLVSPHYGGWEVATFAELEQRLGELVSEGR